MKRLFATGMILAGLAVSTATAQTGTGSSGTGTGAASGDTTMSNNNAGHTERDDDGFNLGWLGLIGLLGLIPRKQKVVQHDHISADRPSTNRG
jgi:hypothetical protein